MERAWTSPTLGGERVLLRPLEPDDAAGLWAALQDPQGRRLTGTHRVFTYCQGRREKVLSLF